ncbi:hypothetical protein EV669_104282 [Gulbenkiania mobilis]|uniref:Uncharacterized protein n=1 Tax=Gulbenkiania mobilis TaxID=397457 RepID=A0ABY2CX68_GULMO|nr:hypothetical protein EV669_104282 [Gulbenkiania mobilis]
MGHGYRHLACLVVAQRTAHVRLQPREQQEKRDFQIGPALTVGLRHLEEQRTVSALLAEGFVSKTFEGGLDEGRTRARQPAVRCEDGSAPTVAAGHQNGSRQAVKRALGTGRLRTGENHVHVLDEGQDSLQPGQLFTVGVRPHQHAGELVALRIACPCMCLRSHRAARYEAPAGHAEFARELVTVDPTYECHGSFTLSSAARMAPCRRRQPPDHHPLPLPRRRARAVWRMRAEGVEQHALCAPWLPNAVPTYCRPPAMPATTRAPERHTVGFPQGIPSVPCIPEAPCKSASPFT